MVDESGDASPITSFEVTAATLAEAGFFDGDDAAGQALASFKRHVCSANLRDALEHDWFPASAASDESPGYFAYLCLTLLVASSPDDGRRLGGDFHDKLRRFLNVTVGYRALPGVATKWHDLQEWLETRRSAGLPYRSLVFPAYPANWIHIGLTRKLAFPAKSDATLIRTFLTSNPNILSRPLEFIHLFQPYLANSPRASDGMRESFQEFSTARLAGDRFIAEHPFWRLANFCVAPTTDVEAATEGQIICSFDEDGVPIFRVVRADGTTPTPAPTTLSDALRVAEKEAPIRAPTLRYGMLAFEQSGYGQWRSVPGLEATAGSLRLAFAPDAHKRLRDFRGLFALSEAWYFSIKPMPAGKADELASLAGVRADKDVRLEPVSVFDGVRTGGSWLGLPPFLPRIASGSATGTVRPGREAEGDLSVVNAGGTMQLRSTRPVGGPWFVEPSEGRAWCKRLTFATAAYVHDGPRGATANFEMAVDWEGPEGTPVLAKGFSTGWSNELTGLDDLAEAVYAGGRSGWDESELTALIQSGLGPTVDPWAILRVLADASFVQPRLRPQWRGRVWTLRPPALRMAGDVAVVDGAVGTRLIAEFKEACALAGVKAFRRNSRVPLAPAVIGCAADGADLVCARLGWPILPNVARPGGRLAVKPTPLLLIGRQPASRWDWQSRRFVADGQEGKGRISLTRWSQPGARDHDIYLVSNNETGETTRLLSRAAAVVLAHGLAGAHLFAARDGLMIGLSREAHLPDALAETLRIKNASNAGVLDNIRTYVVDDDDLSWLGKIMPSLIEGLPVTDRKTGTDAVSSSRHANGRIRLAWSGGQLAAFDPGRAVFGGEQS
ncbi:hypothetical protein ABS772_16495 [Methylorubrum podarium]|uniref:Uncharacterized protein n=1 Tax=Methylorubrum podarium TaxID=200476 RepID=A0ABV1QQ35_9HYPH